MILLFRLLTGQSPRGICSLQMRWVEIHKYTYRQRLRYYLTLSGMEWMESCASGIGFRLRVVTPATFPFNSFGEIPEIPIPLIVIFFHKLIKGKILHLVLISEMSICFCISPNNWVDFELSGLDLDWMKMWILDVHNKISNRLVEL